MLWPGRRQPQANMSHPILKRLAIVAAVLLSKASLGTASEVSYIETFETTMFSWVSTTEHSQLADWPNSDPSTARENGQLRVWGTFLPHKPASPITSFKSIVMNRSGEIRPGCVLELRADVLRVAGAGAYAALGWQDEGLPEVGYALLLGAADIALVKHRFDQKMFAPLFWENRANDSRPVTLMLRLAAIDTGLNIEVRLLDAADPGQVLFTRTILDTADREPVAVLPAPFQSTEDSGPPWLGAGRVCLSLMGGNTTSGRLEMDIDNFGLRVSADVTEADSVPLMYTHASNQKLAYRLFSPPSQEPGTRYPLVLHLHGREGIGDDNIRQFSRPGVLAFVSPENQLRHPCFMVSPQISTQDANTFASQYPYTWTAIRPKVVGLLTNLMTELPIDRDRVYVTGTSLGGIGTWSLIAAYPELFAAAVPVAGLGDVASMRKLTRLPVWAFHGGRDQTIAVSFTQSLIAELRRWGASPIYTEYTNASHVMFESAYRTPGLVDWALAQRRGTSARHAPWIEITTPTPNGIWPTSYADLTLAGETSRGSNVIAITWRNETTRRSGSTEGQSPWTAQSIPLRTHLSPGTAATLVTNLITVTATLHSESELYGGTTTFNTALQVAYHPIRMQIGLDGGRYRLEWDGAAPAFVIQRCADLRSFTWVDHATTTEASLLLSGPDGPGLYRIRLP